MAFRGSKSLGKVDHYMEKASKVLKRDLEYHHKHDVNGVPKTCINMVLDQIKFTKDISGQARELIVIDKQDGGRVRRSLAKVRLELEQENERAEFNFMHNEDFDIDSGRVYNEQDTSDDTQSSSSSSSSSSNEDGSAK